MVNWWVQISFSCEKWENRKIRVRAKGVRIRTKEINEGVVKSYLWKDAWGVAESQWAFNTHQGPWEAAVSNQN